MKAIDEWWAAEKSAIEADNPMRGRLMLAGGIIYGGVFLGIFATYCLASILAPANRRALQGCTIAFYTDHETHHALINALARARDAGIHTVVRPVPDSVMQSDRKWERIAAAQNLQVQMAALAGAAAHCTMPDQIYNDTFFPNLFRLIDTEYHTNIVHNGLNAHFDCADDLQKHRQPDGSLAIPAKALNDIAWKHRHGRMLVMNGQDLDADRWTNGHYQLWRARDRVLMFGPHNSLSYLSNAACRKLYEWPEKGTPTGTLDVWVQRLCDTNFHVPQIDDDVSVIGFESGDSKPHPQEPDCTRQEYVSWSWAQIRYHDPHLVYYQEPMAVLPVSIDESAPTVDEVMDMQARIVNMMIAGKV